MRRNVWLALWLCACGGLPPSAPPAPRPPAPSFLAEGAAVAAPSTRTPTVAPAALVGQWLGPHAVRDLRWIGGSLAILDDRSTLVLLDASTGSVRGRWELGLPEYPSFAIDGHARYAALDGQTWDLATAANISSVFATRLEEWGEVSPTFTHVASIGCEEPRCLLLGSGSGSDAPRRVPLPGIESSYASYCWAEDGRRIAVVSPEGTRLLDVEHGALVAESATGGASCVFRPGGGQVAVVDAEGAHLLHPESLAPLGELTFEGESTAWSAVYSADGRRLVVTSWIGEDGARIEAFAADTSDRTARHTIVGELRSLAVAPDGTRAALSTSGRVELVGLDGTDHRAFSVPSSEGAIAFDSSGQRLAYASTAWIEVIDVGSGDLESTFDLTLETREEEVSIAPLDRGLLLTGSYAFYVDSDGTTRHDGSCYHGDAPDEASPRLVDHDDVCVLDRAITFHASGRILASTPDSRLVLSEDPRDGALVVENALTGGRVSTLAGSRGERVAPYPVAAAFDPAGARVYAWLDGAVRSFDVPSGERRGAAPVPDRFVGLELSLDGAWLMVRTGGESRLLDAASLTTSAIWIDDGAPRGEFTPDHRTYVETSEHVMRVVTLDPPSLRLYPLERPTSGYLGNFDLWLVGEDLAVLRRGERTEVRVLSTGALVGFDPHPALAAVPNGFVICDGGVLTIIPTVAGGARTPLGPCDGSTFVRASPNGEWLSASDARGERLIRAQDGAALTLWVLRDWEGNPGLVAVDDDLHWDALGEWSAAMVLRSEGALLDAPLADATDRRQPGLITAFLRGE